VLLFEGELEVPGEFIVGNEPALDSLFLLDVFLKVILEDIPKNPKLLDFNKVPTIELFQRYTIVK
jgi:hypothetical protein